MLFLTAIQINTGIFCAICFLVSRSLFMSCFYSVKISIYKKAHIVDNLSFFFHLVFYERNYLIVFGRHNDWGKLKSRSESREVVAYSFVNERWLISPFRATMLSYGRALIPQGIPFLFSLCKHIRRDTYCL